MGHFVPIPHRAWVPPDHSGYAGKHAHRTSPARYQAGIALVTPTRCVDGHRGDVGCSLACRYTGQESYLRRGHPAGVVPSLRSFIDSSSHRD